MINHDAHHVYVDNAMDNPLYSPNQLSGVVMIKVSNDKGKVSNDFETDAINVREICSLFVFLIC